MMMISTRAAIEASSPSIVAAVIINPLDAKGCTGKQKRYVDPILGPLHITRFGLN